MTRPANICLTGLAALLIGCGTTAPVALDGQVGAAVEMARAQQTLNPRASLDAAPVEGMDGKSAAALIDRYHKGFAQPTAVNIFNIGVGENTGSTLGATGGAAR